MPPHHHVAPPPPPPPPPTLQSLLAEDVFTILRPMVHDKVSTVQATAALALRRIGATSVALANDVVRAGLLEDVVATVPGSHSSHMKAGALVVRSLAKHSPELCQYCIDTGCLPVLVRAPPRLCVGAYPAFPSPCNPKPNTTCAERMHEPAGCDGARGGGDVPGGAGIAPAGASRRSGGRRQPAAAGDRHAGTFWPLGGDVHRLPCCLLTLPNIPSHDCAGAGASVEARSVRGAG